MKETQSTIIFALVWLVCVNMTLAAIFAIPFALEHWVMVDVAQGHQGRFVLCIIISLIAAFVPIGILFGIRRYLQGIADPC